MLGALAIKKQTRIITKKIGYKKYEVTEEIIFGNGEKTEPVIITASSEDEAERLYVGKKHGLKTKIAYY